MRKRTIAILIGIVSALFIIFYFSRNIFCPPLVHIDTVYVTTITNSSLKTYDTAFGGIFASPYVNDSLPHYRFKLIEDSLNSIKQMQEHADKGLFALGRSIGCIGIYIITNNYLEELQRNKRDSVSDKLSDSINI